ncbi:MAG: GNAT family N-acetyltransferase [Woeseiaceae bacterium]|nr:GNAT family N-acetyltransferase [Woeseiaceae bacterium]
MAALEIIDYQSSYQPDFERLNIEWLEKYFRVEPIDRRVLGDPDRHVLAGGGQILFARKDSDIVGTVALKHTGDGNYELTKMAVTEAAQGFGVGKALLDAAIARFRELDGSSMYLESHSSLTVAVGLYERAGFVHEPRPEPSPYERADVYMVFRG